MKRNYIVAAAVVAALANGAAFAQMGANGPTIAQVNAAAVPGTTINIAGSSAIKTALTATILANFCGGAANATIFQSTGSNTNFLGVSCVPNAATFPAGGTVNNPGSVYNIWIRYEGGSVSGYLPIVNTGFPIEEINGANVGGVSLSINGSSASNGTDDSFASTPTNLLNRVIPDIGIGDVEPAALVNNNYPTQYTTSVWGPNAATALFGTGSSPLVDEVYALFVNESSGFTETPLNLSTQTIQAILNHKITNWSNVYDVAGHQVATGSLTINIVNREQGSGSRAATDILLVGDGCGANGGTATIFNKSGATQFFSTSNVLAAANTASAGAITYATVDNDGSFANLTDRKSVV